MSRWIASLVAIVALSTIGSPVHALAIKDVRVSRAAFDPAAGESTEIRFHIDQPARIALRLFDGRDVLVRQIASELPPGDHALIWDGKDDRGRVVPSEAYRYVLHAAGENGDTQTYDLTDLSGGERIAAQDVAWNSSEQAIAYRLEKPARVAVRIGLKDSGPLLRTLVAWVPRPGGLNREHWDGLDASRVLDLGRHPKLSIFVDAYTLSDNTLLVGGPAREVAFVDVPAEQRIQREKQETPRKKMHYHHQQPLESRGDLTISITLPDDLPEDDEGLPVVSGRVPVRLDVDPKDRQRAIERRFESVFFVDGTFAFENEVGYIPFTWIWDTNGANPGVHYVTVNLRGYEGNFGVATLKVRVEPPPQIQGAIP